MTYRTRRWVGGAVSALTLTGALASTATVAAAAKPAATRHVLLISVDGLHASDVTKCLAAHLCPTLATLSSRGTTFAKASASKPSDSSPGLMALVTGGTPKLTGVYYDDSYDRTMFAPGQPCTGTPGAETMYAENVDTGASTNTRTILNESIDPTQEPNAVQGGACGPVAPNDFLRTNSIFSVAHAAGLRTAWADKHPAADVGVSGHGTPNTVDDKFMTEINADIIPATLVDTRGRTVAFPVNSVTAPGAPITDSVIDTESYDQIKVDGILNQIDGRTSGGTPGVGTPAIFGMNFQTVSVSQKLVDRTLSCTRNATVTCDHSYFPGGYQPGTLGFTPQLAGGIASVDHALGSMVAELRTEHLLGSTEIIIAAKHGQSPIDPATLRKIGHAENSVVTNAGVGIAQSTDDDIALLWLSDQNQTQTAVKALHTDKAGANTARVDYVLSGDALVDRFGNPRTDPRTPDLIVQPIPGTIYSKSGAKVAEHGGFAADDTHVALIVVKGAQLEADARDGGTIVDAPVQTTQVASTILAALDLNPRQLDSVRIEHTDSLPGLGRH